MHRAASTPISRLSLIALASLAMLLTVASGDAGARASKVVAKEVESSALGKTVLASTRGRTLYSLSVEKKGRFICTGSCLSSWHPLFVPANAKPVGPVKLGTIERPEGRTQVTFKGRPLYAFVGDSKPGEANGEGIKDVGTWHAVTLQTSSPPPPPSQPEPSYPY